MNKEIIEKMIQEFEERKQIIEGCIQVLKLQKEHFELMERRENYQSPQQDKPTGFDFPSCPRREHNSRVIGTQNNLGEKSAVSPEDTHSTKQELNKEISKDYEK